jgi:Patatin
MSKALLDRLKRPGPKRILSLDGGGIRGALSLGFLTEIETLLRRRHGNDDLLLCDYFDLIGGTSTGAVIAAGLATGMTAKRIEEVYLDFGGEVFSQARSLASVRGRFDAAPLRAKLLEYFGDIRLGGEEIRTGLCIVTKRLDTNSIWPLINHPEGMFYQHNALLLLRQCVRASTAAPTYFQPEELTFYTETGSETATFIDGGVSLHNNPALLLFMIATLHGFPFRWSTGEDDLLIVSIGTGHWEAPRMPGGLFPEAAWEWARVVPSLIAGDALWANQLMLQWMSRSPTSLMIDREVGDLREELLGPVPLLTYLRYNVELHAAPLAALGCEDLVGRLERLKDMSDAANRADLNRIGHAAAAVQITSEHFPEAFDLH